ncbi:hypothetical protein RJP21_05955 [Paenibacillus sp. VCA1]|uniref:hypothetical protein n=1 Tax=Paenibacillus sp. VCA1 TaxID=3039148 RepID=UPI002870F77B|nr:hypothetical protein [Paenibacillus sp. VCA1]MDR9853144.1 hypothetical protein [Paenibacillus sp. VCA1]
MKGSIVKIAVPAICAAIALSGCTGTPKQKAQTKPVRIQSNANHPHGVHRLTNDGLREDASTDGHPHLNSIKVIPKFNGEKVRTTNENGTTYSGMGSGVYSRIGTSSLHNTPESKTLEDRLESAGITGISVLTLGDSVYIGDPEHHTHIKNSEPQPHKVLSPNEGSSGRGYMSQKGGYGYTIGQRDNTKTNLQLIRAETLGVYGKKVKVYTVHDPKAIQAIKRVKTAMRAGTPVSKMSKDMAVIKKSAHLEQNK